MKSIQSRWLIPQTSHLDKLTQSQNLGRMIENIMHSKRKLILQPLGRDATRQVDKDSTGTLHLLWKHRKGKPADQHVLNFDVAIAIT